MTMTDAGAAGERADLQATLAQQRGFLRYTLRDLSDAQAARRTTVSELCLAGLIKHVTAVERQWAGFILDGPAAVGRFDEAAVARYADQFRMLDGETVAGLLDEYERVAERTGRLIADLPDLDATQPLPEAPWFPPGARWSARQALLHILAETAQHAGHADIIREALDGAKTMG